MSDKPKTVLVKTIEQKAPWYKFNPYTPYYFKDVPPWIDYLERCSSDNFQAVKSKLVWLHRMIIHHSCERKKEVHTKKYYDMHYGSNANPTDRKPIALIRGRLQFEYNMIQEKIARNWTKPPPAMASVRLWEAFLINCMDVKIFNRIDTIIVKLLNYLNVKKTKSKEKPSASAEMCSNYLEQRKTKLPSEIPLPKEPLPNIIPPTNPGKKRTW